MLVLPHDDNAIRNGHVDFIMIIPMVGATIAVRQMIHIIVVFARSFDPFGHTHLFANVLHVMALLKDWILFVAVGEARTCHCCVDFFGNL